MSNGEIILYTTEDGRTSIRLRAQEGTIWLTQLEIAELFQSTKQNISLHIKNILSENELSDAVVKDNLTTAAGKISNQHSCIRSFETAES